jgi:hypothetical protein
MFQMCSRGGQSREPPDFVPDAFVAASIEAHMLA